MSQGPARQTSADLPPAPYSSNRLGERIERMLVRMLLRALNGAREVVVGILSSGLELFFDVLKPVFRQAYGPLLSKIRNTPGVPPELQQLLDTALTAQGEAGAALAMAAGQAVGGAAIGSITASLFAPLTYAVNRWLRPARLDLSTLHALSWRGLIADQDHYDWAADQGWANSDIAATEELARPRADIMSLAMDAWRRSAALDSIRVELRARGYRDSDIDVVLRVIEPLPSPPDLVRMAVREAFSADAISQFQLHADFPAPFAEWMKKQGYSEEWSRAFWAAHWELPSIGYGTEMLHRGLISSSEFSLLLKTLDISPFWRPKLEAMSYSPLTRVDVRRMYQSGVVDRATVVRTYLDLGYNAENANRLADWTAKEYGAEDKSLAKSDVLDGFRRGLLTEAEARDALEGLEYPAWAISFYLERERAKLADEIESKKVAVVQRRASRGIISMAVARQQLEAIGLPSSEIDVYLDLWQASIADQSESPSVAKLEEFYGNGIISADQLSSEMRSAGYADQYVRWYLGNLDAEARTKADAEAERARADAEKIAAAKAKTAYESNLAQLNVQLALQRQRIVNARSALNATLSAEQLLDLEAQIGQLDVEIATARADIAARQKEISDSRVELQKMISDVERERLEEIISSVRVAVADAREKQAEAEVAQAKLDEEILTTTDADQLLLLKADKLELETQIAELKQQIEAQRLQEAKARADLRAKIPDDTRERLERTIQDDTSSIAAINVQIADAQQKREETQLLIQKAMTDEDRLALQAAIRDAQDRIVELNVQKAKLKVE